MKATERWTVRHNYTFLLVGLLSIIAGGAMQAQYYPLHTLLSDLAIAIVFIVSVWSLVRSRIAFIFGWVLAASWMAASLAGHLLAFESFRFLGLCLLLAFFVLSGVIAGRDVFFGGAVTINRLVGAVCVYLLIGLVWTLAYFFVEAATAGAFDGLSATEWNARLAELGYFSFVTLTTLGFGDISPVSPLARVLAYIEAIVGQMYLTVLVAALVGMHIADYGSRSVDSVSRSD
ncbi:MAG: two pore domain potassium channel family protein [Gammaproteobacteria bacterium]|nr:two pore domain potassium channel family protein [Gammaproteobacteria bacterium]NIR85729.1 two pore domain potassium channel family protein [Gammaproteobacteria bacterium]NIR90262.1 two pore domain potassium channel family protein [Gammaproteobacteria bacterium]NIU06863.1 two pore domain potassium channel family protein [Gammaproteobacteria bacterium]NIV53796.1 two pore domain potassium channel family protein [Gammaproteobacteria bacterium]